LIALRWFCWVPLILLGLTELYVRGFDGWGAWAAAPLLLVPAVISLVIVTWGFLECLRELRDGRLSQAAALYTLIAALPLLWLLVRRFVV
jgi:membrane protein YdbS with pleckstrin-like domain